MKQEILMGVSDFLETSYSTLAGDYPAFRQAAWVDKVDICRQGGPALDAITPPGMTPADYMDMVLGQEDVFRGLRLALDGTYSQLEYAVESAADEDLLGVVTNVVFPTLGGLVQQIGGDHKEAMMAGLMDYQELVASVAQPSEVHEDETDHTLEVEPLFVEDDEI